MKRNAIHQLIEWKEEGSKYPFFMFGMRGCGKTWLALDFAKTFFEGAMYLCLENNDDKKKRAEQFCANEAGHFIEFCSYVFEVPADLLGNFLIIFDEVEMSETVWKFIVNHLPAEMPFSVLFISGHGFKALAGMPSRYLLHLYPLRFDEFLNAIGSAWYADIIQGHFQTGSKVPGIVHEELMELFEDYLATGGMPYAINEYLLTENTENLPEVHRIIYGRALNDIHTFYDESTALKMRQVLDVVPAQLKKANQKFQYRMIRRGATYALFQNAIENLQTDSLLLVCPKSEEANSFKLFPGDVGIYTTLLGTDPHIEPEKTVLECYLMQNLTTNGYHPFFWESSSQAHVDFLIRQEAGVVPIDARSDNSSRNKSITIYRSEHATPYALRIGSKNFDYSGETRQIPYYAAFCI